MTYLDQLKADQAALTQILQVQRSSTPEPAGVSAPFLRQSYLLALEDALKLVTSQIEYLSRPIETTP